MWAGGGTKNMAAAFVYVHKPKTLVDKQAFRRFCLEFVIENDEFKPKSAFRFQAPFVISRPVFLLREKTKSPKRWVSTRQNPTVEKPINWDLWSERKLGNLLGKYLRQFDESNNTNQSTAFFR